MIDGFVFYLSFWDAIQDLSDEDRLAVYDAVCRYALTGEVSDLTGTPSTVFKLIRPQLDANRKRRENAQKGGRPRADANQNETKAKPNVNQTETKPKPKEKEKEKEKEKVKEKNTKREKPTVEEVRAYCLERGNGIDAQTFWDFYESKGWLVGKSPMKDWRACVRTWEKRKHDRKGATFLPATQQKYDFAEIERALVGGEHT